MLRARPGLGRRATLLSFPQAEADNPARRIRLLRWWKCTGVIHRRPGWSPRCQPGFDRTHFYTRNVCKIQFVTPAPLMMTRTVACGCGYGCGCRCCAHLPPKKTSVLKGRIKLRLHAVSRPKQSQRTSIATFVCVAVNVVRSPPTLQAQARRVPRPLPRRRRHVTRDTHTTTGVREFRAALRT